MEEWSAAVDFCSSYQHRLDAAIQFKIDLQRFLMIAHRFKLQFGNKYEWMIQKAELMKKNENECRYQFENYASQIVKQALSIIWDIEHKSDETMQQRESTQNLYCQ